MTPIVAGNWKMHTTVRESLQLVDALIESSAKFPPRVTVVVAPPFTSLEAVSGRLRGQDRIALGAQTMHWKDEGPFTGEISPVMLQALHVEYVIIGHSERRAYCAETDQTVNLKARAALNHGITPIIAVGETLAEREAGKTQARVVAQTEAALKDLGDEEIARCVLAYEPIWAIGTGKNDDPQNADSTMSEIRGALNALADVRILYGGSVKPDNMRGYATQKNINGALVGGASLSADSFTKIIEAAAA